MTPTSKDFLSQSLSITFIFPILILEKEPVFSLLNKLFDLRYFPADWSEGFIVPLHKKGILMMFVTIDVCNYRGITLLSNFGKPFTKVLNDR